MTSPKGVNLYFLLSFRKSKVLWKEQKQQQISQKQIQQLKLLKGCKFDQSGIHILGSKPSVM